MKNQCLSCVRVWFGFRCVGESMVSDLTKCSVPNTIDDVRCTHACYTHVIRMIKSTAGIKSVKEKGLMSVSLSCSACRIKIGWHIIDSRGDVDKGKLIRRTNIFALIFMHTKWKCRDNRWWIVNVCFWAKGTQMDESECKFNTVHIVFFCFLFLIHRISSLFISFQWIFLLVAELSAFISMNQFTNHFEKKT